LKGLLYSTLEPATRRRFAGTQIVAHVIEPQTPDEVKYDIFNRVNTGGSPLTAQEIRHCMSKTRSRHFLKALVESPNFDKALGDVFWNKDSTGNLVRDNLRMSDREMALRFCAFRSVRLQIMRRLRASMLSCSTTPAGSIKPLDQMSLAPICTTLKLLSVVRWKIVLLSLIRQRSGGGHLMLLGGAD